MIDEWSISGRSIHQYRKALNCGSLVFVEACLILFSSPPFSFFLFVCVLLQLYDLGTTTAATENFHLCVRSPLWQLTNWRSCPGEMKHLSSEQSAGAKWVFVFDVVLCCLVLLLGILHQTPHWLMSSQPRNLSWIAAKNIRAGKTDVC